MAHNNKSEKDELRARFTSWLTSTLRNARKMYYRSQETRYETIPFDELPLELKVDPINYYEQTERTPDAFDFEEERLAKAFFELPLMRREVLRLLFVCEMTPDEISRKLHCSPGYVRKQKYYALKKLRELLGEE